MVAAAGRDFQPDYPRSRCDHFLSRAGCGESCAAYEYFLGPEEDLALVARRCKSHARRQTFRSDRRVGKWTGYEFVHAETGRRKNHCRAAGRALQDSCGLTWSSFSPRWGDVAL